jgi:hypothetical protein
MTDETFAVVRLPRPRVLTLVTCDAYRFGADVAYQFAKPPAVLVRLAGDGFTVLAGKGVEADLGADPKFWTAVVATGHTRQTRPPAAGLPAPGDKRASVDGGRTTVRSERCACGSAGRSGRGR